MKGKYLVLFAMFAAALFVYGCGQPAEQTQQPAGSAAQGGAAESPATPPDATQPEQPSQPVTTRPAADVTSAATSSGKIGDLLGSLKESDVKTFLEKFPAVNAKIEADEELQEKFGAFGEEMPEGKDFIPGVAKELGKVASDSKIMQICKEEGVDSYQMVTTFGRLILARMVVQLNEQGGLEALKQEMENTVALWEEELTDEAMPDEDRQYYENEIEFNKKQIALVTELQKVPEVNVDLTMKYRDQIDEMLQ